MKKTINYFLTSVAAAALLTVAGCSKSDTSLPAIDGYNNSNEVGSTNLVAHWTFDDNNNEVISGKGPIKTTGTVGSIAGQMGKALQLTAGALVYPAIDKINAANSLNNYTVSLWVIIKNTKGATGSFSTVFALAPTGVSDIWPDIFLGAETGRHLPTSDTLELKGLFNTHPTPTSNILQDNIAQLNTDAASVDLGTGAWFKRTATSWVHFVITYDGSANKFRIYGNGVSVGGYNSKTAKPGLQIMAAPMQAIFGSFPSSDLGFASAPKTQTWAPPVTASVDDVRIFNTVLAQKDVTALYNLGIAGR